MGENQPTVTVNVYTNSTVIVNAFTVTGAISPVIVNVYTNRERLHERVLLTISPHIVWKYTEKAQSRVDSSLSYRLHRKRVAILIVSGFELSFLVQNHGSVDWIAYTKRTCYNVQTLSVITANSGASVPTGHSSRSVYFSSYITYIWAVIWNFQQCGMCDQQWLRPACAYAQTDQSLC